MSHAESHAEIEQARQLLSSLVANESIPFRDFVLYYSPRFLLDRALRASMAEGWASRLARQEDPRLLALLAPSVPGLLVFAADERDALTVILHGRWMEHERGLHVETKG